MSKISGPLLDRIDIHVEVTPVDFEELTQQRQGESSAVIRERVVKARQLQADRYETLEDIYCNAQMTTNHLRKFASLDKAGTLLLKNAMDKLNLSARAYDRILKVSRTIADLSGEKTIAVEHLAEAIQYRSLDRENWAG